MKKSAIQILHEDDDVLVINKPAGLIVHSDGRTQEPTVVDWLLKNYPDIKGVGDPQSIAQAKESTDLRPGIVHRLDRETSGVLLIVKHQKAFWYFKKQFGRQLVHKEYRAFVYGLVKNDSGLIDRPIARSRSNPTIWSAQRGKKGEQRDAVTEYEVVERGKAHTFLALFPRTGRTHQIRVHLKAINYPIVCDRLYAPNRPCELGFKRLALHAKEISFLLPSGERRRVEAPFPQDFKEALEILKNEAPNPNS